LQLNFCVICVEQRKQQNLFGQTMNTFCVVFC